MIAKSLKGVEHFCDNSKCGMHATMFPVRPHDPLNDHVPQKIGSKGVRYTFMRSYSGLEVEIHLCEPCYKSMSIGEYAWPKHLMENASHEPACFNPKCNFHGKTVISGVKELQIPIINKTFSTGPSATVMEPVKYEVLKVYRHLWFHLPMKGGETQACYLCDACNNAFIEFGEGETG